MGAKLVVLFTVVEATIELVAAVLVSSFGVWGSQGSGTGYRRSG